MVLLVSAVERKLAHNLLSVGLQVLSGLASGIRQLIIAVNEWDYLRRTNPFDEKQAQCARFAQCVKEVWAELHPVFTRAGITGAHPVTWTEPRFEWPVTAGDTNQKDPDATAYAQLSFVPEIVFIPISGM